MLITHKQNDITYYCYKWNSSILKKIYRLRKKSLDTPVSSDFLRTLGVG